MILQPLQKFRLYTLFVARMGQYSTVHNELREVLPITGPYFAGHHEPRQEPLVLLDPVLPPEMDIPGEGGIVFLRSSHRGGRLHQRRLGRTRPGLSEDSRSL